MNAEALTHTAIAVALVVGYVVLTALGHDGNDLLVLLGGQALGIGGSKAAQAAAK